MKYSLLLFFSFCLGFAPSLNAQTINTENSVVNFKIGNMKIRTVKGNFQGLKGAVNFDPTDLAAASFDVCLDVATVNTGNKKRDAHLLKEDFFFEAEYPQICFYSTTVKKIGDAFQAKGGLVIRGIAKEVVLPFTFDGKTFRGTLEISRYAYGVGMDTGTFMVAENVELEIIGELAN